MPKQVEVLVVLGAITWLAAALVVALTIAGAATAALYVIPIAATVLACGLEYLRRVSHG